MSILFSILFYLTNSSILLLLSNEIYEIITILKNITEVSPGNPGHDQVIALTSLRVKASFLKTQSHF